MNKKNVEVKGWELWFVVGVALYGIFVVIYGILFLFKEAGIGVWNATLITVVGSVLLTIGLGNYVRNKNIKKLREELRWVFWAGLTVISAMIVSIVFMIVFITLRELGILT